jgi:alkanesulfonate monooxygenase SsuD/methylene tetrahydromethanopterin reductase-like flavin-dependent oxidoreductase (luciferase family)
MVAARIVAVILDVQFNSATTPWPEMRDAVLAAESAGYGVAWVVDHLAGEMMGGDSMLECCTLTGALAATTTTIGVGTLVANVWNRPVGVLAAAAATAQMIAAGRFWLGIGAGASPDSPFAAEHRALGIELSDDIAQRHERVSHFLTMAREMWATGMVNGVSGFPMPPAPIPLLFGVNSVALARLAATEADAINIRSNHPRLEEIIEAAKAARPDGMGPLVVTTWARTSDEIRDPDSAERRRFQRIGIDRLIVVQFDRADTSLL